MPTDSIFSVCESSRYRRNFFQEKLQSQKKYDHLINR